MTKTNMDLTELLQKHDQGDLLRSIAEAVLQLMMESDVDGLIGAGRHERAEQRTTWRNGYRDRSLDTRLGTLNLKVPKLRQGSYFPGFLEARKTSEQALVAVIQEAWIFLLDQYDDAELDWKKTAAMCAGFRSKRFSLEFQPWPERSPCRPIRIESQG